jgi:hypothetical protein
MLVRGGSDARQISARDFPSRCSVARRCTVGPRHGRDGFRGGHRRGDHRSEILLALGILRAGILHGPVAQGLLRADRRGPGGAGQFRAGLRVLPCACGRIAAHQGLHHRPIRGGARHRPRRGSRRTRNPGARFPQGGDGGTRRSPDQRSRSRRRADCEVPAVLLFQRGAALGRDGLHGVGAGTRLPARRFRSTHDSPDTREDGRAHQSGVQSGRPRQAGRVVLSVSQGQDGPGHAAAAISAVLVQVRVRGHQPRCAPAHARDHQGHQPNVLRLAPRDRARACRCS